MPEELRVLLEDAPPAPPAPVMHLGSIARIWRHGAHHDTWISCINGLSRPLILQIAVTWDDGVSPTAETVAIAPLQRWARNLIDYRPYTYNNTNAGVRILADGPTAIFGEIWFGKEYQRTYGYGYVFSQVPVA